MNPPQKILITGGNRGIGKAIAEKLLSENFSVLITSRKLQKGEAAKEELIQKTGNQNIQVIKGDLSSIADCYRLVQHIKENHDDIDCFISNAGVWMTEKIMNQDNLEISFMVNYLAPYILCKELLPILQKNGPSRIVNVNAGLYIKGKLDLAKTPYGEDFHPIKTYANTKLCNVLFSIDFANLIEGSEVSVNTVHPGIINTGLGDSPKFISKVVKFVKRFWKKPEYGAIAPVWLASSSELDGINGKYFNEKEPMEYIDYVLDEKRRLDLKSFTEELLESKVSES